jgi:hypothetical protein
MNNVTETSLIEFYHLPGLGVKEQATILMTGTLEDCQSHMADLRRFNLITGDTGYRYEIHPAEQATTIVDQTNQDRERDIAEFRHRVYGEPLVK